jgi:acyl-CoA thioesterase
MSHTAQISRQEAAVTHFDRTTGVHRQGDALFSAHLDESWESLRGVHGGYVTALAVRAAEATAPDRAVRTVATSFLRPTEVGPAHISMDVVRAGRSFTTVVATMHQRGRAVTNTRITMLVDVVGHDWSETVVDRPAPFDQCIRFTPPPMIRHFDQADLRIDPATLPAGDADDARIAGHVRPVETRPFDAAWLVMIGDWFPPSPFRRNALPIGGVSIDYTVHVHRTLAASDDLWLEGVFEAGTSAGGIAVERGAVSTPDGRPVIETFHTRWTA